MDDLGFNKIAAAVLATGLGFMMIKEVSHLAMHKEKLEKPVYALEIEDANAGAEEVVEMPFPQAEWVAAMNVEDGAKQFKKCTSCHNADIDGANATGPNLWNVLGQPAGGKAGFGYSNALMASGIVWDYESLDGFLTKPSKYLPGTNMNYIGLKRPEQRAALIEYLRVAADAPIDRPQVAVLDVAAPAEGVTDMVVENAEGVTETVVETMTGTVEEITTEVVETGTEIVEEVTTEVVETGTDIVEDVTDAAETVGETIQDVVEDVVTEDE